MTASMTFETTPDALLSKDYELKVRYLTDHFSRLWTRFNYFVTIQSALPRRQDRDRQRTIVKVPHPARSCAGGDLVCDGYRGPDTSSRAAFRIHSRS